MPVSDWGAALHFYHKTGSRNGLFNLYSLQKKWGGGIVGTRFIRMNAKDVLFFVKSSSTLSWWNGNIRVHHSKATRCHVVTGSLYLEFAKILELLIAVFNVSFQLRYWFLTDCWLTVDWLTDWLTDYWLSLGVTYKFDYLLNRNCRSRSDVNWLLRDCPMCVAWMAEVK